VYQAPDEIHIVQFCKRLFCHKYSFAPLARQSLPAFQEKLRAKQQPEALCQQAGHAVSLYWEDPLKPSPHRLSPSPPPARQDREAVGRAPGAPAHPFPTPSPNASTDSAELKLTGASWVWVYDGLTSAIQVRHYSPKTLDAYRIWTRKFQTFTHSKDPRLLSMEDVKGFLRGCERIP
jgi:hypothetical protein